MESSDVDVMRKLKLVRVYESTDEQDMSDKAISIIMDTHDAKIGFTRLRFMPLKENSSMFMGALYI